MLAKYNSVIYDESNARKDGVAMITSAVIYSVILFVCIICMNLHYTGKIAELKERYGEALRITKEFGKTETLTLHIFQEQSELGREISYYLCEEDAEEDLTKPVYKLGYSFGLESGRIRSVCSILPYKVYESTYPSTYQEFYERRHRV